MQSPSSAFSRYFPPGPVLTGWGWRLNGAGRQVIAPEAPYPGGRHPLAYLFDASGRRTPDEFQIVFIGSGRGSFESASQPETPVESGQAFLIFPGEWHRYRPARESGWTEYWVGFGGGEAERIIEAFFNPKRPVSTVESPAELAAVFSQLCARLQASGPGADLISASFLPLILAFLKAGSAQASERPNERNLVGRAKARFLQQLDRRTDLEQMARELGCSYSRFRLVFRRQTGYAPREFENRLKLNRAKDLLLYEGFSVSETAAALGFNSVFYFSRAFRRHFGRSPRAWLGEHRAPR